MNVVKYPLPPELERHLAKVCSRCLRPTAGPTGCVWCGQVRIVARSARPLVVRGRAS